MKTSTIYFIIGVLFLLVEVILLTGTGETEQTNCYDEKNNKINNLTCEKEIRYGDTFIIGPYLAVFSMMAFFYFIIIGFTK